MAYNTLKPSYLFYDIETTGLNPCFDQVLQFAAIRTDLELQELERYEIQVKLNPDIIPSPAAIITHRIGVSKSMTGINEYEAIGQIHRLLNHPGTISLGYNTLGFDDEFLRFSFYRNLLTPYTHQFANGCSRMDLYPMAVLFYLYKPQVCEWPQINNQPSFKLEYLSQLNHLAVGQAHTAMVDVEATLNLARKFKTESSMWDYITGYFNKETDLLRMSQLTSGLIIENKSYSEALLIDGKFGAGCNYLAPVLNLGTHSHYKNQTLWLRLDLEKLKETSTDNIKDHTFVIRKKTAERELLLPMKERFLGKFSEEKQNIFQQNKQWLIDHPQIFNDIIHYHQNYTYPKLDNVDADGALYEIGFPTRDQENLFRKFHQCSPESKNALIDQINHPTYQQLAKRIMYRHYPNLASNLKTEPIALDYRGQKKLTKEQALAQIHDLQINHTLDIEQQNLLIELQLFLK